MAAVTAAMCMPDGFVGGYIEIWNPAIQDCSKDLSGTWEPMWLSACTSASGQGMLLQGFGSEAEAASGTGVPLLEAHRPYVVAGDTDDDFRIEAVRAIYHCCTKDTSLRTFLLQHCATPIDIDHLKSEYPIRVGPDGRYWLGKQLGSGGYANVVACVDSTTGKRMACKVAKLQILDPVKQKREVVLHAALRHDNVVAVRDVVYIQPGEHPLATATSGQVLVIMDMQTGGEFFSLVKQLSGLDEARCRHFFRQLLLGIAYCHSRKVCHRDLKLENLLLDGTRTRLKITDFGFARSLANSNATSILGTVRYVAPEMLSGEEYDGRKADMWACGVLLFVMRECDYPFKHVCASTGGVQRDHADGFTLGLKAALESATYSLRRLSSEAFKDLLACLLNPDPTSRYTASEALNHPWVLGADWTTDYVQKQLATMDTDYVKNPEGENPEIWLAKLNDIIKSQTEVEMHVDAPGFDSDSDIDSDLPS